MAGCPKGAATTKTPVVDQAAEPPGQPGQDHIRRRTEGVRTTTQPR